MYEYNTDSTLRVGDAERERTAERLRQAHTEGRIDVQELQQRIDRCYRARTVGDLGALVADLPGPPQRRQPSGFRPWLPRSPLLVAVAVPVTLMVVSSVVSAVIHAHLFFWPALLLFLLARSWRWRHRRWNQASLPR